MAGAGAGPRRCLCSAQWKLRDKAVAYVAEGLRGGTVPRGQGSDHARELVCALAPLLRELLADKVAAVAVAAMQVRSPPVLAPPSCLLGGRHCTHSAAPCTPGRLGYLISERTMWSGRRGSACFRDCAGRIVLSDPVERAWICDGRQPQCKLLQPGVCLLKATARGRPAERHMSSGEAVWGGRQVVQLVMTQHAAAAGRDASRMAQEVLPALIDRCGDPNLRNRKAALETVAHMASVPEAALATHTHIFVRCTFCRLASTSIGAPRNLPGHPRAVAALPVRRRNRCFKGCHDYEKAASQHPAWHQAGSHVVV